jgi:hypothetical protein
MSWLSQAFGANPINKDWNLESTGFAQDMASKMWDVGDVHGQQLIRQNFQDATPSLDSMLGVQQATGGSGAIGRQLNQQQLAMSGNQASDAILKSRSMDAQRALAFNRQAQQGEQYTASNEYQQSTDNRMRRADFTNQLATGAMGGGIGKGLGMLGQAGSTLFGGNTMNKLGLTQEGLSSMAAGGGLFGLMQGGASNLMSGIGNTLQQGYGYGQNQGWWGQQPQQVNYSLNPEQQQQWNDPQGNRTGGGGGGY